MTTEDTCSDCGRPFATELGPISSKRPCSRRLHPVGADDCAEVTIARLRSELATRRTWKVDEATAAELARLKRELASARELGAAVARVVEWYEKDGSVGMINDAFAPLLALLAKQGGE